MNSRQKQRWSLMTVLYLIIRYMGIPYAITDVPEPVPFGTLTDAVSNNMSYTINATNMLVYVMLGVIMIARLHAMYQRSRKMLIFLVTIFLVVNIASGVIMAILLTEQTSWVTLSSNTYICYYEYQGDVELLPSMNWIIYIVWEVLTLCLSLWIAVKHFRDLRRLESTTGSTIGDCFKVLIQYHVLYFASFVCVSCLQFTYLSPELQNSDSVQAQIIPGALKILLIVQMFVLGPRLILSVREYNAKLVADSDAETSMNSIVFQERVHISTSSTV
ncbi:uncharacterized protein F5147DRAFT_310604 [Suillus discolor]|uniref:Uncharacterized protein n=1 Tax=Suillus discolor TaxID=1912936 RepID=A0A9P7JRA2_9AGAM|nr:uncharacterized protein F5147DRAFT_310604 [Suillus discolor]KAG2101559.1 hypothetical protein F5147DRAFT_310604 [Suillus discolor]